MYTYHQNGPVNITILIVDDDFVACSAISDIFKHLKDKDKSFGEIKLITARDWSEAIIAFSVELNKINLLIIDYHILDLNIIQLKQKIYEEFGNLPIIVMSSNMSNEIEQEIACLRGNLGFIKKPIEEENDALKIIMKYAFKSNLKGKSLNIDDNISHWCYTEYEKTILYPDKTVLDPLYDVRMESRFKNKSVSRRIKKRRSNNKSEEKSLKSDEKVTKPKIRWSHDLRDKFLQAIRHLGIHRAVPKNILQFMNDKSLTRENVASHLQKYRNFLKKIRENTQMMSQIELNRTINSNFASSSQQFSNCNPNLTNELFSSQMGYDFGHPMVKVGLHQPFNYLNQIPNQIKPNLLSGLNIGGFGGPKYNNNIGESSSSLNWTFNYNNMNNIHENSNFEFPFYNNVKPQPQSQPQNNVIVPPCGMVSLLQSLDVSPNTSNFQIDHNQHHQNGEVNGEIFQEVVNDDFLENNSFFSIPHIEDGSFDNGNSNEQTSNLTADDLEMYCPIRDNNHNNNNLEHGAVSVNELPNQDLNEDEFVESLFSNDMP